jgi:hypothetical protein
VYSKRDGKKIRKSFPSKAAAKAWRTDASVQVNVLAQLDPPLNLSGMASTPLREAISRQRRVLGAA